MSQITDRQIRVDLPVCAGARLGIALVEGYFCSDALREARTSSMSP